MLRLLKTAWRFGEAEIGQLTALDDVDGDERSKGAECPLKLNEWRHNRICAVWCSEHDEDDRDMQRPWKRKMASTSQEVDILEYTTKTKTKNKDKKSLTRKSQAETDDEEFKLWKWK